MEDRKIDLLHIEDNEDDIELTHEALSELSFTDAVHVAKDGEEAMAFLRREGKFKDAPVPKLVLLDIRIPKKDGFEVLKEMKADPELRRIPVVMLTTSDREEDVVRSFEEGACSYITKPIIYDHIVDVLRKFVTYWKDVSRIPGARSSGSARGFLRI